MSTTTLPSLNAALLAGQPAHAEKVTIYRPGGFAWARVECRTLDLSIAPYAQHAAALRLRFVGKGKRNAQALAIAHNPRLVALAGFGHFKPSDALTAPTDAGNGLVVQRTRHTSFDPAWDAEFYAELADYLTDHPNTVVLADYRGSLGATS